MAEALPAVALRSPDQVMRLSRLGASHPTRLSFLRAVLRRIEAEKWCFDRPVFELDDKGVGRAVYRLTGPDRSYSLVAFAHDLPAEMRSDRVIATAWDATFALFDGTPDEDALQRLAHNVPLQEAGRISSSELSLARANRSVRLFEHVISRLAAGEQPDLAELQSVGYLMRTTAVYGSGKFGAADRDEIADRPELSGPFRAEMMAVWLIRAFSVDLVEHLAKIRGGAAAATLAPELRESLGVGNSTGLGMAPFLIRHPLLINNWVLARETALARVRSLETTDPAKLAAFRQDLARRTDRVALWHSQHPAQIRRIATLKADIEKLHGWLGQMDLTALSRPWDQLFSRAEAGLSEEGQEFLISAMLEPHGDLIDELADQMAADEDTAFAIEGDMTLVVLQDLLDRNYAWALATDYDQPDASARFWYVSEEKLEPRLGQRAGDAGAALEQPLDIGRMAAALARDLTAASGSGETVADFLARFPEHRLATRRVQLSASAAYAEIRDNLIGADMLPIDLLRSKLAFFGADHFDPRSDLWLRISLFQGAPFPQALNDRRSS